MTEEHKTSEDIKKALEQKKEDLSMKKAELGFLEIRKGEKDKTKEVLQVKFQNLVKEYWDLENKVIESNNKILELEKKLEEEKLKESQKKEVGEESQKNKDDTKEAPQAHKEKTPEPPKNLPVKPEAETQAPEEKNPESLEQKVAKLKMERQKEFQRINYQDGGEFLQKNKNECVRANAALDEWIRLLEINPNEHDFVNAIITSPLHEDIKDFINNDLFGQDLWDKNYEKIRARYVSIEDKINSKYDAEIDKLEQEALTLKEYIPQNIVGYLAIPNKDGSFSERAFTKEPQPVSSFYQAEDLGNNRFALSFWNSEHSVKSATSSHELILDPVCKIRNALNQETNKIVVTKPALFEKKGDKFVLTEPMELYYEEAKLSDYEIQKIKEKFNALRQELNTEYNNLPVKPEAETQAPEEKNPESLEQKVDQLSVEELKKEINEIIGSKTQTLEEKGLEYKNIDITSKGTSFDITAHFNGIDKASKIGKLDFGAILESRDGEILVRDHGFRVNAIKRGILAMFLTAEDKGMIDKMAQDIGSGIKEYLTQTRGKEIDSLEIKDGKLNVSYKL